MSYLDHLRGMQTQFDQARDQAQQNINAVNQNAYVRAEAKKEGFEAYFPKFIYLEWVKNGSDDSSPLLRLDSKDFPPLRRSY